MATLIESYELLLKQYTETKYNIFNHHLCNFIELSLKINDENRKELINHFKTQKPSVEQYPEIYNHPSMIKENGYTAWFIIDSQIRIDFLKAIINKLKQI